ncbi:MAG: GNAT family N-acetyltransferase [Erysipelotrichaceae bacterium]|nr:GNAT family N-acetyltransferase [Erysipelotrichaceae bacterium]
MDLIKARHSLVNDIMVIITDAQVFLREQGIDQWQNNYPNQRTIENDIDNGWGYVLIDQKEVVAYGAIINAEEPTYKVIDNGKWLNDRAYLVIHRIAVAKNYRNRKIAQHFIDQTCILAKERDVYDIRIDTHADNKIMQKMVEKMGFVYCGIIYLANKDKRLAYHKILD